MTEFILFKNSLGQENAIQKTTPKHEVLSCKLLRLAYAKRACLRSRFTTRYIDEGMSEFPLKSNGPILQYTTNKQSEVFMV